MEVEATSLARAWIRPNRQAPFDHEGVPRLNLTYTEACDLASAHGEAFYLYSPGVLRRNVEDFRTAFTQVYPRSTIAYSYKTNYLPALCQEMDRLKALAEVVSMFEYGIAMRAGVRPECIIFNGPYKASDHLERALLAGAVVNLDGAYEVDLVEEISGRHPGVPLRIGLRCSLDVPSVPASRFGFDVARDDLARALERIGRLAAVRLEGLHCHVLPDGRRASAYRMLSERMLKVADQHGLTESLQFIDLGGGFYSRMSDELAHQFGTDLPTFADYGEAIARPFAERFPAEGPTLILEPGLAIVADSFEFACRVIDVKQVAGRRLALVAGSTYDVLPTKSRRNLPIRILGRAHAHERDGSRQVDIVGYTCMEDDVLYRGHAGPIEAGDFVVFENVGAYTFVLKPPFIMPAPPILQRDDSGSVRVVRRAETGEDILSSYVFRSIPEDSLDRS